MGAPRKIGAPLRAVHDTNVVLSALLVGGRLAWLRQAWRAGPVIPLVCTETASELLRVLAYPKFQLAPGEREELLADYLPFAAIVRLPRRSSKLPKCRDPHDLMFLALARAGRAGAVITGNRDLLALRERFAVPILTPDELHARLRATAR
jgi:putative PIN family toxin of toxin-antitoxin system